MLVVYFDTVPINIFKARVCVCVYECMCERGRGGGWIPTILFVLCPTLPASLFIAFLCSFHTELMRKTHTLNTFGRRWGTNTHTHMHNHTHTVLQKPTAVTFQMQMEQQLPSTAKMSTSSALSASKTSQVGSRFAFMSLLIG